MLLLIIFITKTTILSYTIKPDMPEQNEPYYRDKTGVNLKVLNNDSFDTSS